MSSKMSTNDRPSAHAFHRSRLFSFLVRVFLIVLIVLPAGVARAAPPPGFIELKVYDGLDQPTALQFAADGRVFVGEKSGIIKVFDSLTDTTPTIFADLNVQVHNWWDRGLLDLKLDPNFPTSPYVYVIYTHDAAIGGTAPRWGTPGVYSDPCPEECVVSGRVSRLQANGNVMTGSEQVLIEDWCQQYPSHSIGSLAFGTDGALYISGGEGASFGLVDYGQTGDPVNNPCGDPPGGVGGVQTPPTAEGGALRSQDLRTSGDPVGLGGTILRVNPATGAALPDNPLAGHADPNARRIIAYGLRNPFRTAIRPGTNEVWVGDVGWLDWEEINRITNPTDALVENFGWPCYEGAGRHAGYDSADLNICEGLYGQPGAVTAPYLAYHHNNTVVPGETCSIGSSSIAGLAFYTGGNYPAEYQGALFFTDYSRRCIWAMLKDANGVPSPGLVRTFVAGAAAPVDLEIGPGGDLFYVALSGSVRRIQYTGGGGGGGTLPSPWASQDIGSVGVVGSASFSNGIFTVRGSGADIGGTVDAFHYAYQPMSGDGSITARVSTLTLKSDAAAKAGVMIRESLSANARHAAVVVTRSNGVSFLRRQTTGGNSVSTAGAAVVAPYWVRLVRSGATFSAYQSSDGVNWALVGTDTISMGQNVFIGLPVTSRNNTTSITATFDNVIVSGPPATNQPPVASINTPSASSTWKVGDVINFSGSAIDPEDETLPPSAMSWSLILHHCPSNCHEHPLQTFSGVASGSFTAPDHEYPSHLELQLTVTDSGGLQDTASVLVNPRTVNLTFQSIPSGLQLTVGATSGPAPFTRTVIVGSANSISAPSPQTLGGITYQFVSWSDGGGQTHNIVAPATATTYTAQYAETGPGPNQPPTATINTPTAGSSWKVGDLISFSGSATDPEDGTLPPSAMSWTLNLQHCAPTCHAHLLQTFSGVASSSFTAPDHGYPAYLELQLTVTDSGGLQDTETLRLDPLTVVLTFQSNPSGLQLTVGGTTSTAPFTRTVIVGSTNSISAPSPQTLSGATYQFTSWSDGGAQTHNIMAPASPTTYTGQYVATTPGGVTSTGFLAPTANGPETVKAGDNNGYEVNPANAYAADGLVATDANSGANPVTSCTSPHKDKHRYYDYNFNIPTMTALKGIEVRFTGSAATIAGAPKICIQLSWSRGDAWTAPQSVPLTTVNTTYVLGSPTDTWGRTWTLGDFSNTTFRVRVIDVASSTDTSFSLDAIAVNVTYQP